MARSVLDHETVEYAGWCYTAPKAAYSVLEAYVGLARGAMDTLFEEDEQITVHPRDPGVRLDCRYTKRRFQALHNARLDDEPLPATDLSWTKDWPGMS